MLLSCDISLTILDRAYNGPTDGWQCLGEDAVGACGCGHAEPQLMMKAARNGWRRAILLVTHSPCMPCAVAISQARAVKAVDIRGIVYGEHADHHSGVVDYLNNFVCPCIDVEGLNDQWIGNCLL